MIEIKDGNYKAETNSGYVLLDIWGESCQPCLRMAPILEEISKELSGTIKVVKMNAQETEKNLQSALDLGVRGIPAIFFFKNGAIVHQWVGFKTKAEIIRLIEFYS